MGLNLVRAGPKIFHHIFRIFVQDLLTAALPLTEFGVSYKRKTPLVLPYQYANQFTFCRIMLVRNIYFPTRGGSRNLSLGRPVLGQATACPWECQIPGKASFSWEGEGQSENWEDHGLPGLLLEPRLFPTRYRLLSVCH